MNKSSSKTTNQQQQQNQRRKKTNNNNNEISKNNNREKFSSNIFLSANCKFLVLDSSDALKECLQNADKTLPLEDIVRLELVNKGEPGDKGRIRCPICLEDPPKFPVVNPCGHVVCSACAQELVARNREFEISSVCPVCLEMPFVDADLRSCVLRTPNSNGRAGTDDDCKVGDRLTFELFERDRDSLATRRCVTGKKSVSGSSSSLWPRAKADEDFACDRYSKYTTISIDEVKVLSEEEVEALEREASENAKHLDRDSTLYCFVAAESAKKRYNMFYEKCGGSISSRNSGSSAPFALCNAIEKTRAAMETAEKTLKIESAWPSMMKNSAASPLAGKMNWATKQSKTTTPSKGSSEVVGASAFARSEVSDDDDDDAEVEEKEEKDASAASSIDASKKYYFYQSSISEKVVLHPVCMKAILSAHGDDFSRIPRKIKVILLEIEKTIVDDAVRNRNPQWRHYSKTTELLVCEGDLREICDRETLNKCEQIIKRAARRKTDEAKKKKEDKKEREKERKLEKERVEKEMVFARDILHRMPKLGHENDVNEKEMDDIFSSSPHQQHQQQQQNFANVAKFGFGARFHDMPSLAPDASSTSAFPSLGEPATMSASKSPNWAQPARMEHIDFDSALSKSNEEMVTTTTTNGGKKKKNSKGTPLFSSSVGRRRV
tara:strand:+ start:8385 stop:10376 length:1992 start_codon:yes stop_codon:yes gene_type:complete